jgi:hypothetical protein
LPAPRRFPPPWTIEEMNDVCFIVRDKNGQGLGYFYYEEEPGRRTAAICDWSHFKAIDHQRPPRFHWPNRQGSKPTVRIIKQKATS